MCYKIEISIDAERAISRLDSTQQKVILNYICNVLAKLSNPRATGKVLKGNKQGFWRYRTSYFRLIAKIKDKELVVLILDVGHRKNIYK